MGEGNSGGKKARVKAVRVKLRDAEIAKRELIAAGLLRPGYRMEARGVWFFLPVQGKPRLSVPSAVCFHELGEYEPRPKNLKEAMAGELSPSMRNSLPRAFDIVGDISILDIPRELAHDEKRIARALLENNSRVKVVGVKGATTGPFRIRKVRIIAGERRTSTVYRENGCEFELDLNRVYFSSRLSFERARIAQLVKPGEHVLALFSGVGPFPIVIARKLLRERKKTRIVAVEWNPAAVEFLEKNIELNKVSGVVEAVGGDVVSVLAKPRFRKWAARVLMPSPTNSISFLPSVLPACRPKAVLHVYALAEVGESSPWKGVRERIRAEFKKAGFRMRVKAVRAAGTYAPRQEQVVFDVQLAGRK